MKLDKYEITDISPMITSTSPVFPGDVPFSRKIALDFAAGDNLLLSSITTTVHIGSHADAPNHYRRQGSGIADRHLHYYLGNAQVVDVTSIEAKFIGVNHIDLANIACPRVLFRTKSFPHTGPWTNNFAALDPNLIEALADLGVITIGIDTPSIDAADSKSLDCHQAIYQNDMAILEGLNLDQVKAGIYELIALPLRIEGADASPVRAVLRRLPSPSLSS
jgi:arylformamidase